MKFDVTFYFENCRATITVDAEDSTARHKLSNTNRLLGTDIDDRIIAGKTGTAQVFTVKQDEEYDEETVAEKMRDHALFIAYAPIENPQIAITVVVEYGEHGSSSAAPIAREIIRTYLKKDELQP